MNFNTHKAGREKEKGVALLIAIFVLLIISAVAVAMVVSSGSESTLAGNYRAATRADFAAVAGLEEARGRLLPKNPNYFNNTSPNFVPAVADPLPIGDVRYILNPLGGEVVAPTNVSSSTTYPDNEYAQEHNGVNPPTGQATVTSVTSLNGGATPGPAFKWVRLTAATERSLGIDVDKSGGVLNDTRPLYYDGSGTPPSLLLSATAAPAAPTPPTTTSQGVTEITALAVVPGGGQKLLRYVVAAQIFNLDFPSALTLGANNINFHGATSMPYHVNGQDGSTGGALVNPPGCTPNPANYVHAIGATTGGDVTSIVSGIPRPDNYTGSGSSTPDVSQISLNPKLDTPQDAYNTVQAITAAADVVINGNATEADMPAAMSLSNPMTIVVDGNFSMTGNFTGYGLLVVTGNFAYSGTTGWKGIVMVVGDGTTTYTGAGGGNNEFDGAIYVATIWDSTGHLLTTSAFGAVSYDISGGGGNGVYYNSCWITTAQKPSTYKVLSFREIPY
jgi:Tfp pilus assembly protein PilX